MIGAILAIAMLAADVGGAMPVRVTDPWTIEVGPGAVDLNGRTVTLGSAVKFSIMPSPVITVQNEPHEALPVFNEKAGGWGKGTRLTPLITQECSATGALVPATLVLKPAPGAATPFTPDTDYRIDGFWATIGRVEDGPIDAQQTVYVDYQYSPDRLDTIAADAQGHLRLVEGALGAGAMEPPALAPGESAVVNVWVPSQTKALTDENLFPIFPARHEEPATSASIAERLLPRTLARLRAGQEVTIVAWGDSVTNGGGVTRQEDWYQDQFVRLLQDRFPKAAIHLLTAAWGGSSSAKYLEQPHGAQYDFVRDVLEPKPDLVTIEFVNDAYLSEEETMAHYRSILARVQGAGAEVVLVTPHLVRPDWLKSDTFKVKRDPRPYVAGLRRLSEEDHIALADAAAGWCDLWRVGIPYTTLLANSINHPDVRGHAIFASRLMALFPEQ